MSGNIISEFLSSVRLPKRIYKVLDKIFSTKKTYQIILFFIERLPNQRIINQESCPEALKVFKVFSSRYRNYLNSKTSSDRKLIAENYIVKITNILFSKNYINFAQLNLFVLEEYFLSLNSEEEFEKALEKFSKSADDAGERYRTAFPLPLESRNKKNRRKVAFCGHGLAISGYEVVVALADELSAYDSVGIYVMHIHNPTLTKKELLKYNIEINENQSKSYDVFEYRNMIVDSKVDNAIWVMPPMHMIFLFSFGLSNRQTWLSQYLRPNLNLKSINNKITLGGVGTNKSRIYNNNEWKIIPQILPARTKTKIIYCPARLEKIKQADFLQAVIKILKEDKDAHFKWSGYSHDKELDLFFLENNLESRHSFVGWKDADGLEEEIAGSDLILSTFPLGLGTVECIAAENKIPIVSFYDLEKNLYWRDIYWEALNGDNYLESICLGENRESVIRINTTVDEYVASAVLLLNNKKLQTVYTDTYFKTYKYAFFENPNKIGRILSSMI